MVERESAMSSEHASSVHGGGGMHHQHQMHHANSSGAHFNSNTQSSNQPASVLNNFDFTAIDELDPSLGKCERITSLKACRYCV